MDNKKSEGKGGGKAKKSSRKERRKEQNSCKKKEGKCRGCTLSKKQKTNKKMAQEKFDPGLITQPSPLFKWPIPYSVYH